MQCEFHYFEGGKTKTKRKKEQTNNKNSYCFSWAGALASGPVADHYYCVLCDIFVVNKKPKKNEKNFDSTILKQLTELLRYANVDILCHAVPCRAIQWMPTNKLYYWYNFFTITTGFGGVMMMILLLYYYYFYCCCHLCCSMKWALR